MAYLILAIAMALVGIGYATGSDLLLFIAMCLAFICLIISMVLLLLFGFKQD